MSLFPRALVSPDTQTSFSPLFRLLDDFDNYKSGTTGNNNNNHHHRSHLSRSFNPKFDIKELANQYELHGELPGIERKDVEIEFIDPQTLTVRGRTERSFHSNHQSPTGRIEDATKKQGITEKGENHNATVEDEEAAKAHETTAVATTSQQQQEQQEPEVKYWVSERSVGEFYRSFSFPSRVDLDGVTASMKNGILSIVVPKAKEAGVGRKIAVS